MPVRVSITGAKTRLGAWCSAITFSFIGLAAIGWGISIDREYRASAHWPTTQASLDLLDTRHPRAVSQDWEIQLAYHFDYAGRRYLGHRIQPRGNAYTQFSTDYGPDYAFLKDKLKTNQPLPCYFDPTDPSRCFLFRRPTSGTPVIGFGLAFLLTAPLFVLVQRRSPTDLL